MKCTNITKKIHKYYFEEKNQQLANSLNLEVTEPTVLDALAKGDLVKKRPFIFILSSDNRCGNPPKIWYNY